MKASSKRRDLAMYRIQQAEESLDDSYLVTLFCPAPFSAQIDQINQTDQIHQINKIFKQESNVDLTPSLEMLNVET